MAEYKRVIPRDFFNEAKLLNGIGYLTLAVLDGYAPDNIAVELNSYQGFNIKQTQDGDLFLANVSVYVFKKDREEIFVYHPYNERDGVTLMFQHKDYAGEVFKDPKTFTQDFIDFCKS